jgi:hypothetical protein
MLPVEIPHLGNHERGRFFRGTHGSNRSFPEGYDAAAPELERSLETHGNCASDSVERGQLFDGGSPDSGEITKVIHEFLGNRTARPVVCDTDNEREEFRFAEVIDTTQYAPRSQRLE